MSEPAARESAWISAHVFYQGDLDDLLTHVVAPLTDELTGSGMATGYFFLRYWDGGPHLRLRVLPADETHGGRVEELICARFGDYFVQHPATDRISPRDYDRLAGVLARREGVGSYASRLMPNNSVVFIPYRREDRRPGASAAMWAVERHFIQSSRIALRVVTLGESDGQRVACAAALILLAWSVADPDARARASCASGVSGRRDSPGPMIDLARRMRALAICADGTTAGGTLVDWARSVTELRASLVRLDRAGTVWGVLDICAHLICNRIGLSIDAEAAVRRSAGRAFAALAREG
jgi:thiopeptide-type bacteriocin biosynthesis protein